MCKGCSQISKHSCWNVSRVWEQALSCSNRTPFDSSLAFSLNYQLQPITQLLTVTFTIYHNIPFLKMLKDWSMWIPKQCEHTFSNYWLSFKLLFDSGYQAFPFHKLRFALWLAMVDPYFIMNENMTPKDVVIIMILVQEAVTDFRTVTSMLFHELFWNPPCINTMKVKFVVDDLIGRTVTYLQLVCHFTDNHALVVEN